MGHQTEVNERNGSPETAPRALARDVGEFAYDVLTLAELQAQLLVTDLQECGQRGLVPGLVLICGVALGLACFPVALAALALLFIQVFETSYAAGFLTGGDRGSDFERAPLRHRLVPSSQTLGCLATLATGTSPQLALDQESARA